MPTLKEQYLAMTGANQFLWDLWKKERDEIRQGYRGCSHSVNRCNAEYADCWKAVEELRERVTSQAQELREANAAIGKLQGQAVTMEEALRGARDAYSEVKKTIKQSKRTEK